MIEIMYQTSGMLLLASLVLGFIRFIKGPDTLNRIIAFDLIALCVIAKVILFSSLEKSDYYIEMILIFCLLGFATTIGITEYLYRSYQEMSDE